MSEEKLLGETKRISYHNQLIHATRPQAGFQDAGPWRGRRRVYVTYRNDELVQAYVILAQQRWAVKKIGEHEWETTGEQAH